MNRKKNWIKHKLKLTFLNLNMLRKYFRNLDKDFIAAIYLLISTLFNHDRQHYINKRHISKKHRYHCAICSCIYITCSQPHSKNDCNSFNANSPWTFHVVVFKYYSIKLLAVRVHVNICCDTCILSVQWLYWKRLGFKAAKALTWCWAIHFIIYNVCCKQSSKSLPTLIFLLHCV